MKFKRGLVELVALIILALVTVVVLYTALDEFGLIEHEIKNEPFEYPKQE